MKRTSILKHILILGVFVLFPCMESNAHIDDAKDRAACKTCKKKWFEDPYYACMTPCLAAEKGDNAQGICIEKCTIFAHSPKNGEQFTKCVLKTVSFNNQQNCLFQFPE